MVSNIRLKLKVKRRIIQLKQKHQTNSKLLRESEIIMYKEALATSLQNMNDDAVDVEDVWVKLKDAVGNAQTTALPLVDSKPEADWMTDEVRLLSLKKQQAWLSWKKNTDNLQAREEYTKLKKQTCRAVEKAKNAWWEEQVKEIEAKYEMAVKSGRGGSLLKELKHLRLDQKSKSSSALKTADGQGRLVKTQDKTGKMAATFQHSFECTISCL